MGIYNSYYVMVGVEIPEDVWDEKYETEEDIDRLLNPQPDRPAYIIYSSMGDSPIFAGIPLMPPGDKYDETYHTKSLDEVNLTTLAWEVIKFVDEEFDIGTKVPQLISFTEFS